MKKTHHASLSWYFRGLGKRVFWRTTDDCVGIAASVARSTHKNRCGAEDSDSRSESYVISHVSPEDVGQPTVFAYGEAGDGIVADICSQQEPPIWREDHATRALEIVRPADLINRAETPEPEPFVTIRSASVIVPFADQR
jgi:hypothetical protein